MTDKKYTTVLTIAGSDSGGGAGIQADVKTISALGCYATTAITAITVQNTLGVSGIHSVPTTIVKEQMEAVLTDIGADAVKIGMLHLPEIVDAVAGSIVRHSLEKVVLDPVMVSTSGHRLIETDTIEALKKELFPQVLLITPNLDEAGVLLNRTISTKEELIYAARELKKLGCNNVLLKGGHLPGERLFDILITAGDNEYILESEFIFTKNVHGTGCSLSSAIAAYLALGNELVVSVQKATEYIKGAIRNGADITTGKGNGPLNHLYNPLKMNVKMTDIP